MRTQFEKDIVNNEEISNREVRTLNIKEEYWTINTCNG